MSAGDTRMRAELLALPQGVFEGANRYDTDDEHVLHLWRDGQSWDIRVSKVQPVGESPLRLMGVDGAPLNTLDDIIGHGLRVTRLPASASTPGEPNDE